MELKHTVTHDSGLTVWFTGLSGAGKSTLSQAVQLQLTALGFRTELLDGDIVRQHLGKGLGFSREDRDENVRRIGFVANLLTRHGVIVLVAVISPYISTRREIRSAIVRFLEVYVNAPLSVCEKRDPKGLYGKARTGELRGLTGIDDPYEPPVRPEVECRTDIETVSESASKVLHEILTTLGSHPLAFSARLPALTGTIVEADEKVATHLSIPASGDPITRL